MKKWLTMLLVLTMGLSLTAPALAEEAETFSDVPESYWACAYIERAARAGAVKGTGGGRFFPEEPLGMAEFTALLIRGIYGEALAEQYAGDGEWYSGYTAAAAALGLYEGTTVPERFAAADEEMDYAAFLSGSVNWEASRFDMAYMMSCLLGSKDALILVTEEELQPVREWTESSAASVVADWEQIPEKYRESAALCYYYGLLTGTDDQGPFDGNAAVTRAQAAVMLCRLLDAMENGVTPVEFGAPAVSEPDAEETAEPEYQGPRLANGQPMTEENVLAVMLAFKEDYPEGMRWTNANLYTSHALRINGYGCAGFALILSDAAFGDLPISRKHNSFDDIRAGDMLRVRSNSHTVIVLEKKSDSVIIAEGNYNDSIHWGRELTREYLEGDSQFYVETRYPEGA